MIIKQIAKQKEPMRGTLGRPVRWPRQSGQSLLELALLTPLLLLLVIGTIEMGHYAYIAILVNNAARAGVSWGAQSHITAGDSPDIAAVAAADFDNNGPSNLTVTSAYSCGCDNGGTVTSISCTTTCAIGSGNLVVLLQVTATGKYKSLFNWPGIPSPLTFSSTATQRIGK